MRNDAPNPASELLREGVEALNHDRFASAQRVFEKVLASEPSQPVALYLLGVAHFKQSDWAAAETCLRQAMAISPNQPDVCLQLAQTLRALHRPDEAVPLCRKVLLQAPGHVGALVELAKAHQESQDWEAAEKIFRQLLGAAPAADMAALALGEILCTTGRAEEAEILLRAALAKPRAKDDAETRDGLIFQLAVSLRAQRRYPDALQELERLTSEKMCVRVEKALVLQHLSRFDEAARAYDPESAREPRKESLQPQVCNKLVSGREIFICDNFIDRATVIQVADLVKSLHYQRQEKSRPDLPATASSADIPDSLLATVGFFSRLKQIGQEMFPGEHLRDQRVYVNSSVYGDTYFMHRDCLVERNDVTVLYYANREWQAEWGGETIFYNDDNDAEVVVSPRPGRIVVSRGAILHRAGLPTRLFDGERLTIAYKLQAED